MLWKEGISDSSDCAQFPASKVNWPVLDAAPAMKQKAGHDLQKSQIFSHHYSVR